MLPEREMEPVPSMAPDRLMVPAPVNSPLFVTVIPDGMVKGVSRLNGAAVDCVNGWAMATG